MLDRVAKARMVRCAIYTRKSSEEGLEQEFNSLHAQREACEAYVLSVTQAFNTTSSMGRLTLNVLLSFAQFEREVNGERIRDKIAASKRKGLWMGGFVPMGYAANGRTLTIVEADAAIIRRIYARFLALGSILRLKDELDRDGVRTRAFTSASNRSWGARPFSVGHLRLILTNPIYCGEIAHKGERFKAQHPPIVALETFAAVQQLLASSRRQSRIRAGATEANLLSRLLVDADGRPLVGDHAKKATRRYRYYVGKPDVADALRIPAGEIEPLVIQALAAHLCDRAWLMDTFLPADAAPELIEYLGREAATLAAELQHLTPSR